MKRGRAFWGGLIFLFLIQRVPQVGCDLPILELCQVSVEPQPVFLLGSNLTVECRFTTCPSGSRNSLKLNSGSVKNVKEVDDHCNKTFRLTNVRTPTFSVTCLVHSRIGCGMDLHGGLPPPKPENIVCETSRAREPVRCSWRRAAGLHLPTTYRLSVHSENGSLVFHNQTEEADEFKIARRIFNDEEEYVIDVKAQNPLGSARSDPLRLRVEDMVIPDTPFITHVEFEGRPIAAALRWNSSGSPETLRAVVGLDSRRGFTEVTPETEPGQRLIRVRDLEPLTQYRFQVRTCDRASGRVCSQWSSSVTRTSPGKGPTLPLTVWRRFVGAHTLELLWKAPPPDDYSGQVLTYKVFWSDDGREPKTFAAAASRRSVQVPAEGRNVSISAVTSYGSTPPAPVPLRHSGAPWPVLSEWTPAAGGAVSVSWWSPGIEPAASVLHYVVEWTSEPVAQLQWKRLERSQDHATITGLSEGVRFQVSLLAVTTGGVSAPSSLLVYSKQLKPASGPVLSVLSHEPGRVRVRWDDLPVDQRRGFITNYTIYIRTLESNYTTAQNVSGSAPRPLWLSCPDGTLTLQLSASTSDGEGPGGPQVVSGPAQPAACLIIVLVFMFVLLMAVTVNLLMWSCVRKRIKQTCVSCGPSWLVQTLPKPGNSNAIRLLQQDGVEPSFSSTDGDPLLSPITLVSSLAQQDAVCPIAQVPLTGSGAGQASAQESSYKPQISVFPSKREEEGLEEEKEEEGERERGVGGAVSEEGVVCPHVIGGLLGLLLPRVDVDLSDSDLGFTFELLRPRGPEEAMGDEGEGGGTDQDQDQDRPALGGLTQDMADACPTQDEAEAVLTGGYFPQLASTCWNMEPDTKICAEENTTRTPVDQR